jgi:arginine decarboxylase
VIAKMPTLHAFVAGRSEGMTPLNAFDGALLDAGVGNTNLVKMSSIVPPGTREVEVAEMRLPPGALVPIAYAAMESDIPGSMICAAVAAAWPEDPDKPGLIMEYHAHGHREDADEVVKRMVQAGMEMRGWPIRALKSKAIDLQVKRIGAVFAAVVLWDHGP